MGILSKLEARPFARGGYAAAEHSRLTASLANEAEYINTTLRHQRRALVARARQGAQNNPYLKRFFQLCVDNIAGPCPFKLQAKIKYNSGKFDTAANRQIEDEWCKSGRKGNWEVTRRWARTAFTRLLIRTLAIDGEVLVRKLRGREYGPNGYRLQLIDSMRLDDLKNVNLQGGGAIHMGVELEPAGAPVAYHILKRRPAQWQNGGYARDSERVPAADIEHIFIPDFAEQNRGVPWTYAALLNLIHIGAFEQAAVIAARVGATQMGFIQQKEDATAPLPQDGKDAKGNPQIDADPGSFPVLPPGYEISGWNPRFPDAAVDPFLKAMLRGTASGLGVAYHNLANDPAEVNFSTARVFGGDEHEMWRGLQNFWVDHWEDPNYADWLRCQVVMGRLPFDLDRLDKYLSVYFQAKTWQSPDPVKEQEANDLALRNKLKSRTRIVAENGEDIEDTFDEIAAEEQLAKDKKIDLSLPDAKPKPADKPVEDPAAKQLQALSADLRNFMSRPTEQPVINVDARSTHHNAVTVPKQDPAVVNVDARTTIEPAQINIDAPVNVPLTVPEREVHVDVHQGSVNVEAGRAEAAASVKPWPTETTVTKFDDKGRAKVMQTRPLPE